MKKIAIIDDVPEINTLIKKILSSKGDYKIIQYFDGKSAMSELEEIIISDLIILDVMLPEISGLDIYEKIKSLAPDKIKNIIFLTARGDKVDFFEDNSCKYLIKPFDPSELLSIVESMGI
ncbi:MAG TPA: response regulator [Spirochaetota bacterium]|nr:response regulator [Spirochaetota bacterium]HOM37868.1 response regulator [Spirochaetota bacterium]HPQ48672.1 response regulator [Spirochaetota bacterium]